MEPEELVKLSSNENPHGPSPAAVDAASRAVADAHVYPTAAHADLTERLADEWDVDPEQVWVGPGADGALDYLSRATLDPGDRVLVPSPGFAYYGMSARYHHGSVAEYPLSKADGFAQTAEGVLDAYDGERIVYVTTPHNPTGSVLEREELRALLDGVDDRTLVVVDEAYGEYSDEPSAVELLDARDDLAVTRTFSKAYGLAGLRIGYAVVPESWADAYARVNTPFAANVAALAAASAALDDDDHVERSVESARWARAFLAAELDAPTFDTAANFVLADVGDGTAVAERAQQRGVIVRDTTSFGLPGCVRVSCGTESETRRAVEVLNDVLAEREAVTDASATGMGTEPGSGGGA
ncbi:histidinol-phosphate aminotransferase [Candidatus Halobonum tyrrellensis G22]|uniref:Histidinol-phosphate aminotransferase n=2 Tax=Candidatus Halobonum TaxID=1431544 RepID=V4HMK4_9EURY|nr:histidinol-phosphate aminotransferase [Candidatus Halobonum tyrrellensis G22]